MGLGVYFESGGNSDVGELDVKVGVTSFVLSGGMNCDAGAGGVVAAHDMQY